MVMTVAGSTVIGSSSSWIRSKNGLLGTLEGQSSMHESTGDGEDNTPRSTVSTRPIHDVTPAYGHLASAELFLFTIEKR